MFRTFRLHPKWSLAANFYLRFIFLPEIKSMKDVTVHKRHDLYGICFHLGSARKLGDVFGTFNSLTWWHQQPQRDCRNACFWASPLQTDPATWSKLAVTQPSKAPNTASKDCHPVIVVNPTNREAVQFLLAHLATCRNRQQEELPVPQL